MELPDEIRDDLEARANVVGTAIGPKRVDDQPTDEECVIVLVTRKMPTAQLADGDRIPTTVVVDGRELKTDVQEVGDVRSQATTRPPSTPPNRKRRWRPAPAGVSLGHPDSTAGTMGSPALETDAGETVVVTNAHVAAPIDAAGVGDPVYQPGPADGGSDGDSLGSLHDAVTISREGTNSVDSALVRVDAADVTDTVLGIGSFDGFEEPRMGATYTKSGRTTGVTTGDLRGRDARIRVRGYYRDPVVFTGVDMFGPMSAAGDSGSFIGVVEESFSATHLLFAGSDRATMATPMAAVFTEHGDLTPVSE